MALQGQDLLLDLDNLFLKHHDNNRLLLGFALSSNDDSYARGGKGVLLLHSTEVWKLKAVLALVSCWVAVTQHVQGGGDTILHRSKSTGGKGEHGHDCDQSVGCIVIVRVDSHGTAWS
jgi:hypothetical protein